MAAEKVSISLDGELLAAVRAAAADSGASVSSWLADAAAHRIRQRYLREALDSFDADDGPMDDAEVDRLVAEARRESRISGRADVA